MNLVTWTSVERWIQSLACILKALVSLNSRKAIFAVWRTAVHVCAFSLEADWEVLKCSENAWCAQEIESWLRSEIDNADTVDAVQPDMETEDSSEAEETEASLGLREG